jgi:MFS family permease
MEEKNESDLRSFCKLYRLNLGVSVPQMLTYYFCVFITVSCLVFINVTAPFVLDNYLHIRKGEAGNVAGSLAFYNEIVIIAVSSLWGSLSDKMGRRWVWTAGFYVMGLGFYLYPLATSFWELFIFRVVYAIGAAASSAMITAVLGDYVLYQDRGKASGLVGFVAGCGAVFAVFVYMKIPYWVAGRTELSSADCGRVMFFIVIVISAISTVVAMLGLQPRWKARSHQPHATLSQILREGLLAARKPIVALSYAAGFGARGDSVIITLFLSLWVTQEALRLGYSQPEAAYAAGTISGIAQICALLFAPFAGVLVDKVNRVLSLAVLSCVGGRHSF